MRERLEKGLWLVRQQLDERWKRLRDRLWMAGVLPYSPEGLEPLEGAMQDVLPPVEPSDSFRQGLRDNLAIAAQRRISGLVVEYPNPFRQVIILGISAGLVAATIATLLLVRRTRPVNVER